MWEEPLAARCAEAVHLVAALPHGRRILVLADADVDGVAAAAALVLAFQRVGRRFAVRLTRRRDPEFFAALFEKPPDILVTADLGAAEVPRFRDARLPTIVLDHHVPAGDGDGAGVVHVNPHLVGEDGSATASGAAVAVTFATALLESEGQLATDLLPYAFLGAEGDRYHGQGTTGLHARIAAVASALGDASAVGWRSGPPLGAGPVAAALAGAVDPLFLDVAEDAGAARAWLSVFGVDADADTAGLSEDDARRLGSALALDLVAQGADPAEVEEAFAPRVVFGAGARPPLAHRRVAQVAEAIDAAARAGAAETALAGLLGHPGAWAETTAHAAPFRLALMAAVRHAADRLVPLGPGHLLRIPDGRLSGAVADRATAWTRAGLRPLVVLGAAPHRVKVSLRARAGSGAAWGLDAVAGEAARAVGGVGGGHHLAAGASVPPEKEAAFLEHVARLLSAAAAGRAPSEARTEEAAA